MRRPSPPSMQPTISQYGCIVHASLGESREIRHYLSLTDGLIAQSRPVSDSVKRMRQDAEERGKLTSHSGA
jgi:hypothetical protein